MVSVLWVAASAAVSLTLVYLGAWVAHIYSNSWRIHRLTKKIPGPVPLPLIGNVLYVSMPLDQLFGKVLELCGTFGYLFRLWMGPFLLVCVCDPEDLQVVLTSSAISSKPGLFYEALEHVLGRFGLISLNGSDFRRHRKAITSSMHLEILQDFVSIFSAKCRDLETHLDVLAKTGEVFDPLYDMGRVAGNSVSATILASEFPGLEKEQEAFLDAVQDGSKLVMFRSLRPWFRNNTLFRLSPVYKRYYELKDKSSQLADMVLTQKSQLQQSRSAPSSLRRRTFLETFLASPEANVLSRAELLDELKTILFAGTGTSMDFQSTFLMCMSMYPEVQRKVQQELDDVFGADKDRHILASDLPHMQYLECALKEVLRVLPPVPAFARVATQDLQLPSGNVLPKGCFVAVFPFATHRHPKYFPNPDKFDPDRFLPENCSNRHPYSFIPFSAGVRSCIGQRYGMMFAKVLASTILRRYDVLPDPDGPRTFNDVTPCIGVALSIKEGIRIRLRRRGQHQE